MGASSHKYMPTITERPIIPACRPAVCSNAACERNGEQRSEGSEVDFVCADDLHRTIKQAFDAIIDEVDRTGALDTKGVDLLLVDLANKGLVLSANTAEDVMKTADSNHDWIQGELDPDWKDPQRKIHRQELHDWIRSECLARRDNLFKLISDVRIRLGSEGRSDVLWLESITDRAFKSADTDGNQYIDAEELRRYLAEVTNQFNLAEEASARDEMEEEIDPARRNMNTDASIGGFSLPPMEFKDGMLSKSEFRKLVEALVFELYSCTRTTRQNAATEFHGFHKTKSCTLAQFHGLKSKPAIKFPVSKAAVKMSMSDLSSPRTPRHASDEFIREADHYAVIDMTNDLEHYRFVRQTIEKLPKTWSPRRPGSGVLESEDLESEDLEFVRQTIEKLPKTWSPQEYRSAKLCLLSM